MRQRKPLPIFAIALALLLCLAAAIPALALGASPAPRLYGAPPEQALPATPSVPVEEAVEQPNPPVLPTIPPGSLLPEKSPSSGDAAAEAPLLPEKAPVEEGFQPEAEAPPAEEDIPATPGLQMLDASGVIVYTYAELAQALSQDNGITTVYLGADITGSAGGIQVHASKPSVVIDGCPPGMSAGFRHTFTQYAGNTFASTIHVDHAATREVILRNVVVVGKNYYGVVAVQDGVNGVTITHDGVQYAGAQPVYNRGGTARFLNSVYTLQPSNGAAAGELAEALRVEMGGNIQVEVPSSTASVFWLQAGGSSLAILAGADVCIRTNSYFLYVSGASPSITIEAGAQLSLQTRLGFTYGLQAVDSVLLEEGAVLDVRQHSPESYAALRVARRFEMRPGSSATIVRTGVDGIPLRFTGAGGAAIFDRPARVQLYSSAGVSLRFTGAGTLQLTADAVNLWKSTSFPVVNGVENGPTHIWNKAGDTPLQLFVTYDTSTVRNFTHNLAADDSVHSTLSASTWDLEHHQLLAFGSMRLSIQPLHSASTALSGATDPGAQLLAQYADGQGNAQKLSGAADSAGEYYLPFPGEAPAEGSMVEITAAAQALWLHKHSVVLEEGRLSFLSLPDALHFGSIPLAEEAAVFGRDTPLRFTIRDTRPQKISWRLDASLDHPLQASIAGGTHQLPNALVFAGEDGSLLPLSELPRTVYRGDGSAAEEYTLLWGGQEGVLLRLAPGQAYSATYRATIHWSLIDAP